MLVQSTVSVGPTRLSLAQQCYSGQQGNQGVLRESPRPHQGVLGSPRPHQGVLGSPRPHQDRAERVTKDTLEDSGVTKATPGSC